MTAQEVLAKAIESGVFLYVEDDRLRYRARSGALSAELKGELARHRDSLVAHLMRVQAKSSDGVPFDPPPLGKRAAGDDVPLSYAQQRLWFIDRMEGQSPQYNLPSAFRLTGALDREAFHAAIDQLIVRHEVRMQVVGMEDGERLDLRRQGRQAQEK